MESINVLDFKFSEIDKYDVFYGYCHKLQKYVPFEEITEIKKIPPRGTKYDRYMLKGLDKEKNKLNIQLHRSLLDKVIERGWISEEKIIK